MLQITDISGRHILGCCLSFVVLLPFGSVHASTEIVLYSFTGGKDGGVPEAGLVRDKAGNLYGTTNQGGINNAGTVFEVKTAGTETTLYSFAGGNDGGGSAARLLKHRGGFYGTAYYGGTDGVGTVFEVTSHGTETVVHSLAGSDGANPVAGLIKDHAGNLYGTAMLGGGSNNAGTVFRFTPAGTETLLHVFTGGSDGAAPRASLTLDKVGNLYGTTDSGGTNGTGTVFEITPAGTESVLYSFTGGSDGGHPFANLIEYKGNLYGTTHDGGTDAFGTVFEVTPAGTETVLHSFTNGSDGGFPVTGLIKDRAGNFYGTTVSGGTDGAGTV